MSVSLREVEELKSCPFCGNKNVLLKGGEESENEDGEKIIDEDYYVECQSCKAIRMPSWGTIGYYTAKEAIDAWNKRIFPAQLTEEQIRETIIEFCTAYDIPVATKKYTFDDLISALIGKCGSGLSEDEVRKILINEHNKWSDSPSDKTIYDLESAQAKAICKFYATPTFSGEKEPSKCCCGITNFIGEEWYFDGTIHRKDKPCYIAKNQPTEQKE